MGERELNKNGFILIDALFGLFVMILCSALMFSTLSIGGNNFGYYIDKEIETKWLYSD